MSGATTKRKRQQASSSSQKEGGGAPRPTKSEVFYKERMMPYKTTDPDYPTTWHVYKKVKKEHAEHKKNERQEKLNSESTDQQVHRALAEAARHARSAETFANIPGKEKQAEGMRKASERAMEKAQELYKSLGEEDREALFSAEERHAIEDGEAAAAIASLSSQQKKSSPAAAADAVTQQLVAERNELSKRIAVIERQLNKNKKISKYLETQLVELLGIVNNGPAKDRIQKAIKTIENYKQRSSSISVGSSDQKEEDKDASAAAAAVN